MKDLEKRDLELIKAAKKVIIDNYDHENFNHTVGAAILCKSGNVYTGVNVYSLHGACAEQVALGAAITAGEREFECVVAVRGEGGEEVIPPCGNCRQMMSDYMPSCYVILYDKDTFFKIVAEELLPYSYNII